MLNVEVSQNYFIYQDNRKCCTRMDHAHSTRQLQLSPELSQKLFSSVFPHVIATSQVNHYDDTRASGTGLLETVSAVVMVYLTHPDYTSRLLGWITTGEHETTESCDQDVIEQLTRLVNCSEHHFETSLIGDHPRKRDAVGRCVNCGVLAIDHMRVLAF